VTAQGKRKKRKSPGAQVQGDAHFVLRKLLADVGADVAAHHMWILETERWRELAFALLTRTSHLPEQELRSLSYHLEQLGLLDIDQLAETLRSSPSGEPTGSFANNCLKVLTQAGLSQDEARASLKALCEAAMAIRDQFGGKIQVCLRSAGERILEEISHRFHFSDLKPEEVKYAFTLWLQNVAHLPLSLRDASLSAMCQAEGLEVDHLLTAADELDLNLAFVDDIVHHRYAPEEQVSEK
jgi:hypothetical protein